MVFCWFFLLVLVAHSFYSARTFSNIPNLRDFHSYSRHIQMIELESAAELVSTAVEAIPIIFKEALKYTPARVTKVRSLFPKLTGEYVSRPDIEEELIKIYNHYKNVLRVSSAFNFDNDCDSSVILILCSYQKGLL
jgi:hypothetical protein